MCYFDMSIKASGSLIALVLFGRRDVLGGHREHEITMPNTIRALGPCELELAKVAMSIVLAHRGEVSVFPI